MSIYHLFGIYSIAIIYTNVQNFEVSTIFLINFIQ